jgi:hypothetical protein
MAQRPLLTAATIPLAKYPEEKNRRKKKEQINRDQRREADPDHGARSAALGSISRSVPNSRVASAQVSRSPAAGFHFLAKRQSAR